MESKMPLRVCESCSKLLENQNAKSWMKECLRCYSYNDENGQFDESKREKLNQTLEKQGFVVADVHNFIEGLKIGDKVKWIGIDNKFRIGGTVMAEHEGDEEKYFVISTTRRFNGGTAGIFLQPDSVRELWIKRKPVKARDTKEVSFKAIPEETTYWGYVSKINDVPVKYHEYECDKKRFEKTKKFERAKAYGFKFEKSFE